LSALFSAALALGLGAASVLAAPPYDPYAGIPASYYPQVSPTGGAPFIPNGVPVISSADLAFIESKMPAGKTLIIPPVAPKTTASNADYKAAVSAAAKALTEGVVVPGVTISTLAAEVAEYRSTGSISDALQGFALGVANSTASTVAKQTALEDLAFEAAKANPATIGSAPTKLKLIFNAAAYNNTLVGGVGNVLKKALDGAQAGGGAFASALQPAAVSGLLLDATAAIVWSTVPNAATVALKKTLISGVATSAGSSTTVNSSPANLDFATYGLTFYSAYVDLPVVITNLKAGVAVSDVNYGAIAQGILRNGPYRNAVMYTAIKTGLSTPYTDDLVDSFNTFNTTNAAAAGGLAATYDPAAVVAAGVVRYQASAGQIVRDVLTAATPVPSDVRDILNRATGAYQAGAAATAAAAVGFGGATPEDIAFGAITGAQIGSAGGIARTVIQTAGLTNANATAIGNSAIEAAAAASPSNKPDAYAEIAYNLGNVLKLAGPVGDARSSAAVTAMANAIVAANGGVAATSPTYIAIVAALAGNLNQNTAVILSAGTGSVAGDDDVATNAGATLISVLVGTFLNKYHETVDAFATPGNDARNLALLYAASLANSADSSASLAVAINQTSTSTNVLTNAAISANRTKQINLTIASAVAVHSKANPSDIQQYVGKQILENPNYIVDIANSATVVLPQFGHVIAHTLAFNSPISAWSAVGGILNHSKVTVPGTLIGADPMGAGGRPAAVAAISAGITTGILESTQLSAAAKTLALRNSVTYTVLAVLDAAYNNDVASAPFRQSDGVTSASVSSTITRARGVAGGITGFVAQMVKPNDHLIATNTDLLAALTSAAAAAGGSGYVLDIAQAAAQAFGWVSGAANAGAAITTASDIANAIFAGYNVTPLANIRNAVDFGFNEAAGGGVGARPGAGAAGLYDTGTPGATYYDHHSASGVPVSNIFTL